MLPGTMPRPFLASDVVRYVGEPIAVVVTEERYQGEDAAELVVVDYEPLPVVVDPEDALAGEVLLFPEAGTNVCFEIPGEGVDFSGLRGGGARPASTTRRSRPARSRCGWRPRCGPTTVASTTGPARRVRIRCATAWPRCTAWPPSRCG